VTYDHRLRPTVKNVLVRMRNLCQLPHVHVAHQLSHNAVFLMIAVVLAKSNTHLDIICTMYVVSCGYRRQRCLRFRRHAGAGR
jgi:hypothetical protein